MFEPLQGWFSTNMEKWSGYSYDHAAREQVMFVRDKLPLLLHGAQASVISTHMSKSCILPVYGIVARNFSAVMRCNFYDWKVSIQRPGAADLRINDSSLEKLISGSCTDSINPVYCEGFEESWVFGSFAEDQKKFTVEVSDTYRLFTLLYLLDNSY